MTAELGIALAASAIGLVSSIVVPAIIVGKTLAMQATHDKAIERLDEGARVEGRKVAELARDFAKLEGRLAGRVEGIHEAEVSRGHRLP